MKSPKITISIAVLLFCCAGVTAFCSDSTSTRSGNWTVRRSESAGKIVFSLIESHHGGQSSHESDWPLTAFQGLDTTKAGRQDVHFTIARDAGRFDCDGFLDNGEGAGLFQFYP